jgi:hypothetical protein
MGCIGYYIPNLVDKTVGIIKNVESIEKLENDFQNVKQKRI